MTEQQQDKAKDNLTLNINEYLSLCNPKDVISVRAEKWIGFAKLKEIIIKTFNTSYIFNPIISSISSDSGLGDDYTKQLFSEGEECEILRIGSQGWQKGKLKINLTLEFIPDEAKVEKSPLDDIRQAEINKIQ